MKSRYHVTMGAVAGALLLPTVLMADSITPSSVTATLGVGESLNITKTVTITKGTPTSAKVDVYFLADTTGSMSSAIGAVKASAGSILSAVSGLGDVQFGVGEYKDFGHGDPYAYRLNAAIGSAASAQAGINLWSASGGWDWEEAQLYALSSVANESATGWRAGSARILVWFGDAPGHDPSGGATLASTKAALVAQNIKVEAIDVGSMDAFGQASAIAAATGGDYYAGIDSTSIVDTIKEAIKASFAKYKTVDLDIPTVPGLTITSSPGNYTGAYDRSIDRSFTFDVTITGNAAGTYNFNIYGTVDGGQVATESDRIVVSSGTPGIPDGGSSLVLLSLAAVGLLGMRRMQS